LQDVQGGSKAAIQKGVKIEEAIEVIKKASRAGLEPHVAVQFGYPWESDSDATRTLTLVHYLLGRGYTKTGQASFYCPRENDGNSEHRKYIKQIYGVWKSPQFWLNKLKDIKDLNDLKYLWKQIKVGLYERYNLGKKDRRA